MGTPVLLLTAPEPKATDTKARAGKFDYLQYILDLAGSRSRVDAKVVAGASPLFRTP
jgi:hypothetical protein